MGHYDWLYGSGSTFPLVFTTAVVIVATLVVQGTALGPLVRILGVSKDAERDQKALEERQFLEKSKLPARRSIDSQACKTKARYRRISHSV
jgi:NhaP-type Na+/H+ or K+/H+ antiporter